jgi:hypothetical protein
MMAILAGAVASQGTTNVWSHVLVLQDVVSRDSGLDFASRRRLYADHRQ